MKVLVITSAQQQKINDNLAHMLTAASEISAKCDVLVIGEVDCGRITAFNCVAKVLHITDVTSVNNLASLIAKPVAAICKNYTHVLTAADSYGKDLLPRIAGILQLSQISEVLAVVSPNIFKKPMYAGNVVAEVESFEDIKLLTVRPTSFARYGLAGGSAGIEALNHLITPNPAITFADEQLNVSETVDLAHAKVIVTGGRSLTSKEKFDELIQGLALKLGGAMGASRAAVEAGYAANDCQVGQTGKVVAPEIYVAIGISGAAQHIAGMKGSKTVIAINLDPNAQIFEYSDYGLVADLFEAVPELIAAF